MTANKPGLAALDYRAGTRGSFRAAMEARLSSEQFPAASLLTTRELHDPSIALLDAWATSADVLTFYQERIANECYLRTATERRSISELARLVGYRMRPGVAASVHLAYTLDDGSSPVTIPAGARSNSVPGAGETMQSFETSEDLNARVEWNRLELRRTHTQTPQSVLARGLYLRGTATRLRPNDALLVDLGDGRQMRLVRVAAIDPQDDRDRTFVTLRGWDGGAFSDPVTPREVPEPGPGSGRDKGEGFIDLLDDLRRSPSIPPRTSRALERGIGTSFARGQDVYPRLLTALSPRIAPALYAALRNRRVAPASGLRVFALRQRVSLFGHNAPREVRFSHGELQPQSEWALARDEAENVLFLDTVDEQVRQDRQVVIEHPVLGDLGKMEAVVADVERTAGLSRSVYGLTGKQTMIETREAWWNPDHHGRESEQPPDDGHDHMESLRSTTVYCGQEQLALAEVPIAGDVFGDGIELGRLYDGLDSGRWLIVSGERTDVAGAAGVRAAELVMLSGVRQDVGTMTLEQVDGTTSVETRPGESTHTFLSFARPLAYTYRRDTVTVYGNVVPATHGESRREVLGSGSAGDVLQSFALRQPPLTFVSAPTPAGAASTLEVWVNDVRWTEAESLAAMGPDEHGFVTSTDEAGVTTVTFGTGARGARLPSGQENVRADYRNGIGRPGNVLPGQISQLATRPLGVKEVVNPIRSSGGADAESTDAARENVPLALMALDRLVSVRDYADFSRVFAGVGKASAARLSNGRQELVQVTIAGAEDAPIETSSDLYRNLSSALHRFGDPHLPLRVAVRELLAIVISAKIRVRQDYSWEFVEPAIRAALLDAFGFQRAALATSIASSRVVQVIATVRGVDWVDLDTFASWSEQQVAEFIANPDHASPALDEPPRRLIVRGDRVEDGSLRPAQLAYLEPTLAETLILNEVPR